MVAPAAEPPVLATDETWRGGNTATCDCCQNESQRTWCMVTGDGQPYAVFFASCYDHGDVRESWIDVVFGSWDEGSDFRDHVTFGCRFGPVDDGDQIGASLADAASVAPDAALFGQKLRTEQAVDHSQLPAFWQVIDFVVESDPLVHQHHWGHDPGLG